MKTTLFIGLVVLVLLGGCSKGTHDADPPATRKQPVTDTYFGKAVVDNYRWLEDVNNQDVKDWFKAQGDYTKSVLDRIPGRDNLIETFVHYDKLRAMRYGEISKRGERYFYRKTLPAETVGKLYVREGKTGAETLLFDPTAYDETKTYAMTAFTPSPNGQQVVVGLQEGGAELSILRTIDVADKTFQPESITRCLRGGGGLATR